MRFYVETVDGFFSWMDKEGFNYAILRGFEPHLRRNLNIAGKADFDLLSEDRAIHAIRERYRRTTKWGGIKSDVYSVNTGYGADYLEHPIFPGHLSESIIERRVRCEDRFFIPCDEDYFYSLAYHVAYHGAERSGFSFEDPASASTAKHFPTLRELAGRLHIHPEWTLSGLHELLVSKGYGIDGGRVISYLQNDFRRGRKSYFFAVLANREPGELNLFVIRKVAVKTGLHKDILDELARRYHVVMTKEIPWLIRFRKSGHMRGGKWRRGGKPYIAVVVFDPNPVPSAAEDRKIHPFVFNSNQFFKRDLREWFVATAGARASDNPLHSTDNEAEAIGHLPLFFSPEEQATIFAELSRLRGAVRGNDGRPIA
jgi:hypothetical protein